MASLQIIGGGQMGGALVGGLIEQGWAQPTALVIVEPSAERQEVLAAEHPGVLVVDHPQSGVDAIVAVKPNIVPAALADLARAGSGRVLSIAAGVTLATLEGCVGGAVAVVRAMPNTPSMVGVGAAAIAAGTNASVADVAWARSILESVGTVVEVEERQLDAVTGLSGSGPAYVFLLAEALTAAAVAQGLSAEVADGLTRQTLLGAATLLSASGEDPAVLRQNVTSPGGTTAAGLAVFEEHDFRSLVAEVVAAATARSLELGRD